MNKSFSTFRTFLAASSALVLTACLSDNAPQSRPSVQGQNTVPHTVPKPKTTIALALGGGAFKGSAHIGIIKVLKGNNIPIKIVAGTSVGSIVGSIYASRISSDHLELGAEVLGKTDLANLTLSTGGFIRDEKLQNYINCKVSNRPMQQFPIRFVAVAINFKSGRPVVFNVGSARQIVRASASIPNVLQPVVIGSYKYVDDGLSQPVPTSMAKKLGANLIIAAGISAYPAEDVSQGVFFYLDQTINVMSQATLHQELGRTDMVIRPRVLELGSIGSFD